MRNYGTSKCKFHFTNQDVDQDIWQHTTNFQRINEIMKIIGEAVEIKTVIKFTLQEEMYAHFELTHVPHLYLHNIDSLFHDCRVTCTFVLDIVI